MYWMRIDVRGSKSVHSPQHVKHSERQSLEVAVIWRPPLSGTIEDVGKNPDCSKQWIAHLFKVQEQMSFAATVCFGLPGTRTTFGFPDTMAVHYTNNRYGRIQQRDITDECSQAIANIADALVGCGLASHSERRGRGFDPCLAQEFWSHWSILSDQVAQCFYWSRLTYLTVVVPHTCLYVSHRYFWRQGCVNKVIPYPHTIFTAV